MWAFEMGGMSGDRQRRSDDGEDDSDSVNQRKADDNGWLRRAW